MAEKELYVFLDPHNVPQTRSYGSLYERAKIIAKQLREMGLSEGDRALMVYPSGLDFIDALFGCLFAGVTAVPVAPPKPRRPMRHIEAIAANCSPSVVLTTSVFVDAQQQDIRAAAHHAGIQSLDTNKLKGSARFAALSGPMTSAILQYTSGSTGEPKGVVLSHEKILHNQDLIERAVRHPRGATVVSWLPMFHDMGLIGGVLQSLFIGGRCVLMAPSTFLQRPARWLQTISDYGAYSSAAPNFAYDLCVTAHRDNVALDLSSWRVAVNGAEPIRAETLDRFLNTFQKYGFRSDSFYPCYGLAECTLLVAGGSANTEPTVTNWDEQSLASDYAIPSEHLRARRLVSCGSAIGDQTVTVCDPITGAHCSENQIGEICVTGPSVCTGYWNTPIETSRAFCLGTDGVSSVRTSDRGFRSSGHLYVLGRNEEFLVMFGKKFCTNAVELVAETAAGAQCAAYVDNATAAPTLRIICEWSRANGDVPPAVEIRAAAQLTTTRSVAPPARH